MGTKLRENHLKIIENVAESNGFKEYTIDIEKGLKGENYFGTIQSVTISNKTKSLSLIAKVAPEDGPFRTILPIRGIYLKEIYMYEKVLDCFKRFQQVYKGFAKLVASSDEEFQEVLVMEDLTKSGYRIWNRKLQMDERHIAAVMEELGRFHAVSYAMRKKSPELFKEISTSKFLPRGSLTINNKENVEFYLKISSPVFAEAINGDEKIRSGFDLMVRKAEAYFTKEIKEDDIEEMTVNHGDDWNNNIFFKYEDPLNPDRPTKVCFIDWQLSRFGSPVLDLSYFFFTSASKEILYDHEKYLRAYHESLSESLTAMSCDPEEIFPYSALERHWKKYSKFGLFLSPMIFKLMIVDTQDAPDLATNVKDIKDFYAELAVVSKEEDRKAIGTKIRDLLEFMIENDLL